MMILGVSVSCVILDFSFLNKNADIVEEKLHAPVLEDPKKSSSGLGAKKKKRRLLPHWSFDISERKSRFKECYSCSHNLRTSEVIL